MIIGEKIMDFSFPTEITILDIVGLAGLFAFVLAILSLAEILKRKNLVSGSTTRKIVHLGVGNIALLMPFIFSNVWFALIGPVFFIFFTYFTCPGSPIEKFKLKGVEEGHTYGTVFYAISLTILVALFFDPDTYNQRNIILLGSFMPLVWGDGISAVIGSKFGHDKAYSIFGGTKTLLGSWAAAFATFGAVSISCLILKQTLVVSIYIGLLTGFLTAIVEALTPKGYDNLSIPAVNAVVLFVLYTIFQEDLSNLKQFLSLNAVIAGLIIGATLALGSIALKALTWDGAISGFYFGVIILGLASWSWGAMYMSFFILGSLFTFIGRNKKSNISEEFEKGGTARDSVQAMVNSLLPATFAFLAILIRHPIFVILAGGAIATSLGDTLGTEIGTLSRNKPRSAIKPWIKLEAGSPGAISLLGTLGSILGASLIALIGWSVSLVDIYAVFPSEAWIFIVSIILGGIAGSYLDSIFACTIQKLNKCIKCSKITEKKEHCGNETKFYSGFKWIRNDVVNLLAIAGGSIISLISFLLFSLI